MPLERNTIIIIGVIITILVVTGAIVAIVLLLPKKDDEPSDSEETTPPPNPLGGRGGNGRLSRRLVRRRHLNREMEYHKNPETTCDFEGRGVEIYVRIYYYSDIKRRVR